MTSETLVECVPNFSEGRNPAVIAEIADAVRGVPGVLFLDQTSDCDHNRSVLTFAGPPAAVSEAATRAVCAAASLIDLRTHSGVHPYIGAADVVPFVPIQGITLAECARLAHATGQAIWERCQVPIYFYEAAALRPERTRLEQIRKGGFLTLQREAAEQPERQPDIGGPLLHPTAGATVAGARNFLIAFNINLATSELSIARSIAKAIRTSSGGLPCLKALGLPLEHRGQVQVSMNLTDFETTPLADVFTTVESLARDYGVEVHGSELIGLIPRRALACTESLNMRWEQFDPGRILENRLAAQMQGQVK